MALRALQLLWIVLITALVGNVIADAFAGNPSSVNFAIFVAALDWVVIIIAVIATFVSALSNPIILMAIDGVALFFNFVAGVLLAAKLGVHSCGNKVSLEISKSRKSDVNKDRNTSLETASQTGPTTPPNAATNSKPQPPSTGFSSQRSQPRSSSPSSTLGAAGYAEVRRPCPRFKFLFYKNW